MADPILLWRIAGDMPASAADELTGEESVKSGGRWSAPGHPVVYACTSRALACLESVVHLDSGACPTDRFLVQIEVPVEVWARRAVLDSASVPGWDAIPPGHASRNWGMRWMQSGDCALACVPAVVVPEELNVLLNPLHPDAGHITAYKSRRWVYDPRLCSR
jgi:RES domain-containing protein